MFKVSNIIVALIAGIAFFGVSVQSCQRQDIEEYLSKAKEDIKAAKKYGKNVATSSCLKWVGYEPVTEYAYDAIPFEFFRDMTLVPFDKLENIEAIEYRESAKAVFKREILGDNTEINNSKFAKFFHRFAVDKMTLEKDVKKLLKKDPKKLEEFVRNRKEDEPEAEIKIDIEQYRLYIFLNYVIKCDLEKELAGRKK